MDSMTGVLELFLDKIRFHMQDIFLGNEHTNKLVQGKPGWGFTWNTLLCSNCPCGQSFGKQKITFFCWGRGGYKLVQVNLFFTAGSRVCI